MCEKERRPLAQRFATYANFSTTPALRADVDGFTRQRMARLNAWAEAQLLQGREVMERVIDTDEYRMRPLRPEDV